MEKKHVAFPLFSHYNLCIKYFVEQALDAEYIMQPPMTNRTMEIGSRYSPDSVYTPFKSSLGSLIDALEAGAETLKMLAYLDEMEAVYYKNCGFELHHGDFKNTWNLFLTSMEMAENLHDIETAYKTAKKNFAAIPVNKPERPLRVGIIGEYYTAVDAFSNLNLEQKLADMGVEVHRWMSVTNRNLHYHGKNLSVEIQDYCKYEMGPTSTANIWCAKYYASHEFNGIIHAKSAGCTPEIDIMPVLQNISADYKIPILYLSYDSQTSDTGLDTRLEAFYDMIKMKKKEI